MLPQFLSKNKVLAIVISKQLSEDLIIVLGSNPTLTKSRKDTY